MSTIHTAARREPELNPKSNILVDLKPHAKDKRMYITYTKMKKVGFYPKADYQTPAGIYAFPLPLVWKDVKAGQMPQFVRTRPFIFLLKVKPGVKIVHIDHYSNSDLNRDLNSVRKVFASRYKPQTIRDGYSGVSTTYDTFDEYIEYSLALEKETGNVGNFIKIWRITMSLAGMVSQDNKGKMIAWARLLHKGLGWQCVQDSGHGIIYGNEPTQMLFFSKKYFDIVDLFENKIRITKSPSKITYKEVIEQVPGADVYYIEQKIIHPLFLGKKFKALTDFINTIPTKQPDEAENAVDLLFLLTSTVNKQHPEIVRPLVQRLLKHWPSFVAGYQYQDLLSSLIRFGVSSVSEILDALDKLNKQRTLNTRDMVPSLLALIGKNAPKERQRTVALYLNVLKNDTGARMQEWSRAAHLHMYLGMKQTPKEAYEIWDAFKAAPVFNTTPLHSLYLFQRKVFPEAWLSSIDDKTRIDFVADVFRHAPDLLRTKGPITVGCLMDARNDSSSMGKVRRKKSRWQSGSLPIIFEAAKKEGVLKEVLRDVISTHHGPSGWWLGLEGPEKENATFVKLMVEYLSKEDPLNLLMFAETIGLNGADPIVLVAFLKTVSPQVFNKLSVDAQAKLLWKIDYVNKEPFYSSVRKALAPLEKVFLANAEKAKDWEIISRYGRLCQHADVPKIKKILDHYPTLRDSLDEYR